MKNLSVSILLLFALSLGLTAKSFNKTSFYVAYNSGDTTQYVLVLPSVQKVYTHKAGDILNLSSIGDSFSSFPTYDNGTLCFSDLKSGDSGLDGASVMANKCYVVNFFYIQKKSITSATVFMLYYKPSNRVYEGIAGDATSFKVVKDGDITNNAKSLTNEDYSDFSFDVKTFTANIAEKNNIDTTKPIITLNGTDVTIEVGTVYVDKGAEASDSVNGNITANIVIKNNVNSNVVGIYSVTYNVKNSSNNQAIQVSRTVTVQDTTPPTFTSSNSVEVNENQLSAITLVATDTKTITYSISGGDSASFDVNISTGVVTFKVAPNFETVDTYGFTATATDLAGNEVIQSVTIKILNLPEVGVKKTGQTKSYNQAGGEVTDGSVKDDGFYEKGVTPSYTRDDVNNIVTDHITGLMWQDDESVTTVQKQWVTTANYNADNYSDTSGDTATTYCTNLTLGGFVNWRLPTIEELETIVKYDVFTPSIDSNFFLNTANSYYWSSTTDANGSNYAWRVHFGYGYLIHNYKNTSYYVRCVR